MLASLFNKFFKRPLESVSSVISDAKPGDILSIRFTHPKDTGLVDPSGKLTRRFDPEDLDTCTLSGTLLRVHAEKGLNLVELACHKVYNGERKERIYTLMLDEIKEARILK